MIEVEAIRGEAQIPYLEDLARLRIEVFREWPYLYDGSLKYETNYLRHFMESHGSLLVVARSGNAIVGASTALPLAEADACFQAPFNNTPFVIEEVFYFGESVLLSAHRGKGVGSRFFEIREEAAREAGARFAVFCAVERDANDPRRPAGARSPESLWQRRGYKRYPGIMCALDWRELGCAEDSTNTLIFWIKDLARS